MMENNDKIFISGDNSEDNMISVSDIISKVWAHRRTYIIAIVLFLFIGCFYLYKTPNQYNRIAKVIVDDSDANSSMRELTSFASSMRNFRRMGPNVYNEIETFTSPDLMSIVVSRLSLETSYVEHQFLRSREMYTNTPVLLSLEGENPQSFFSFRMKPKSETEFELVDFKIGPKNEKLNFAIEGHFGDTLSTPAGLLKLVKNLSEKRIKNDITISWVAPEIRAKQYVSKLSATLSGKESSVVVLSLADCFRSRADRVLMNLIDAYNEAWVSDKTKSARNTTKFINDRLVVIRNELGGVEQDLKDYKEKNKITSIESVSQVFLKESSEYAAKGFEISNQISIAKFIKGYLMSPEHSRDLIPANSGLTSVNVESQIKEYNDMLLNRDRLLKNSSMENPMVVDMSAALESLRSAINRSVDNLISTLELEYDKIKGQENEILTRIASTSGQELQLLSIERQQKVKEQLYIYLLQKREENEIASLMTIGNTRVIVKPNGSNIPVAPKKPIVLLAMLVLGCAIPVGYYLLKDAIDQSVKNKHDLDNISIPFLAEIPQIGMPDKWFARLRADRMNNENCSIVVKQGSRDLVNEAFRVLRTNLDSMVGGKKGVKIMTTSFNPNVGKTFSILNMASVMSLKGAKVLLLDVDLRKATLSKITFEKQHRKAKDGFVNYLSGRDSDYSSYVQNITDNLFVLPIGALPPNPSELLLSERFKTMLDRLSEEYDYIFMDCPPVDIVADTGVIAKYADMTIFIIRAGIFDKRSIPDLEELYKSKKYNRMSLLLNGVEDFAAGYGYGRGYGYGYGRGYGYGQLVEEDED